MSELRQGLLFNDAGMPAYTPAETVEPIDPNLAEEDKPRLGEQNLALLDFLRGGPRTNVEIVVQLRILNHTARISDLRKRGGHRIDCRRVSKGVFEYTLVE